MPVRRIRSGDHIYITQQGCRGLLCRTADDFRSFLRQPVPDFLRSQHPDDLTMQARDDIRRRGAGHHDHVTGVLFEAFDARFCGKGHPGQALRPLAAGDKEAAHAPRIHEWRGGDQIEKSGLDVTRYQIDQGRAGTFVGNVRNLQAGLQFDHFHAQLAPCTTDTVAEIPGPRLGERDQFTHRFHRQ